MSFFTDTLDAIKNRFSANPQIEPMPDESPTTVENVIVNLEPQGASGTEVFAGYFDEEYLKEMTGTEAADQYDKMRRSDSRIKMVTSAVKNPIKAATWNVEPASDSAQDQKIAEFIEFVLMNDMAKTWQAFMIEALSVIDFGHAVFEVVHKVVKDHKTWGTYTGIENLAFRSQRTIERWHMDRTGKLLAIEQVAHGDVGENATIPGPFLLIFSVEKEGDNYEGISMLRPCLGPWKRKQLYLKLNAIGIEKFAVPTVIGTVPGAQQKGEAYNNFVAMLKKYTSHQSNYLTKLEGWEIDLKPNTFDPEKVMRVVEFENGEMVVAFLANFLQLGQQGKGGGSYALSFDLSDFFLSSIEHIGWQICEGLNKKVIKPLVDLNFGPQDEYPQLTCGGISDKAGKEFSDMIKNFTEAQVIIPDDELEDHIRDRMGLPQRSENGQRNKAPEPSGPGENSDPSGQGPSIDSELEQEAEPEPEPEPKLAEGPATPRALIKQEQVKIDRIMREELTRMAGDLNRAVMRNYVQAKTKDQKAAAWRDVKVRGLQKYRDRLLKQMVDSSTLALKQAAKTVPGVSVKLAEFEDLPPEVRRRIKNQADLVTQTQAGDLEKSTFFAFQGSARGTEDPTVIADDVGNKQAEFVKSGAVGTGAANVASFVVNDSQQAFYFTDEVLEQVESFTYTNPNPKAEICRNLRGKTFRTDDPAASQYFPPNHHNCKSYLVPNLTGARPRPITPGGLRPTGTEKQIARAEKSMTLKKSRTLAESGHYGNEMEVTDPVAPNFSGAHSHLDAQGNQLGPAIADGELHYHEKAGGGRVEAAHGIMGHVHMDSNGVETGPDFPVDHANVPLEDMSPELTQDIELQRGDLQTVIVSKSVASTRVEAEREAERVGAVITKVDETDTSWRFRQFSPVEIIEGSCRSFKPKNGVTLVFCQRL